MKAWDPGFKSPRARQSSQAIRRIYQILELFDSLEMIRYADAIAEGFDSLRPKRVSISLIKGHRVYSIRTVS